MTTWRRVRIRDVASTYDGPHATPSSSNTHVSGPVFLGISSLENGRLDLTRSGFLSEDDFTRWTRRITPQPGDVVFSYETRLGEAAIIPEGLRCALGRRLALMRPNTHVIEPRFLLYYFLGPEFQETIRRNTVQGSTVDRILLRDFPDFTIELPPLNVQRAISATLGAIDDKIESNRRVSRLAMKLAEALYDQERPNASSIPLANASRIVLGGTPDRSVKDYWDGGSIAWINSGAANQEVILQATELITQDGLDSSAAKMMPAGSTVVAITGATLGEVALLGIPASGNQSLVGVWSDDDDLTAWLHFAVKSAIPDLIGSATGAAQQHVNKRNVEELKVSIPDRVTLERWATSSLPLVQRSISLLKENITLTSLRDALLPELLSGRVRARYFREHVLEVAT